MDETDAFLSWNDDLFFSTGESCCDDPSSESSSCKRLSAEDEADGVSTEFSRLGGNCLSLRSFEIEPDFSSSGRGKARGGMDFNTFESMPMVGVHGDDVSWLIEEEASIQLARLDLTMYLPPLPAGGLAYLGEEMGERCCMCGVSISLPGLLLYSILLSKNDLRLLLVLISEPVGDARFVSNMGVLNLPKLSGSSTEDMDDLLVRLFKMSGCGMGTLRILEFDKEGVASSADVVTWLTVTGATCPLS